MPGISGLGSVVLGRAYIPTISSVPGGIYDIDIDKIETYTCVLRPLTPIALIVKINRVDADFNPGPIISENTIPQT
ncbi:hypothetical protein UFOVP434_58 [uncultured Caudovirales phage]|uniref:Uncharacterized protein n=1 Tax=uncultured Caudovirales phage TaxID=2100421 RepID=A0A6J5MCD4_9CAUD|nr:hypothetical protein UFOVP434_58 [uncultured Caudovirales phage]